MKHKQEVLESIPKSKGITAKELSYKTGVSKPTLNVILNSLVRDGLVDREQTAGHGYPFVYSR